MLHLALQVYESHQHVQWSQVSWINTPSARWDFVLLEHVKIPQIPPWPIWTSAASQGLMLSGPMSWRGGGHTSGPRRAPFRHGLSSPGLSQTMSPLVLWMAKPHKQKCVLSLRPTRTIHKNNTRSSQSKLKSALNSLHWPLGYSSYNMICMNNFCCKVTS